MPLHDRNARKMLLNIRFGGAKVRVFLGIRKFIEFFLQIYFEYFSIRASACSFPNSFAFCKLDKPSSFWPIRACATPRRR